MAWATLAMAAVSAFSAIKQGQAQDAQARAQAQALEVQADWTRFQGRQKALEYKKRAADELEATLIYQSRINAQAGAGLMDPFSGNPMGLKIQALDVGATNFAMAKGNELIVRSQANAQANMQLHQAAQVREAGKSARRSGFFNAALAMAQGAYGYHQAKIPSAATASANPQLGSQSQIYSPSFTASANLPYTPYYTPYGGYPGYK